MQRLAGPEGELGMASAAVKMGLNMTLSSNSTTSLEDVAFVRTQSERKSMAPFWFQIYLTADVELRVPLIKHAEGKSAEIIKITSSKSLLI
jgi:(S)-2-hydroxy-acid oxidase